MRLVDWLAADPARGGLADHLSIGGSWTDDDSARQHGVAWIPATGEVYAVDRHDAVSVLGTVADCHRLLDTIGDWEERQHQLGSLYRLRVLVSELELEARRDHPTAARQPGARYQVDLGDGSWWELGWDKPLDTFYAQHARRKDDPVETVEVVAWHGTAYQEIPRVVDLEHVIGQRIDADTLAALRYDQARFPNLGPPTFKSWAEALAGHPTSGQSRATGPTYRDWLAADPARAVPHLDCGSVWTDVGTEARMRASWVPTTGELYAVEAHPAARGEATVEVLGRFSTKARLEGAIDGWATRVERPGSLAWLRATVDRAERSADRPPAVGSGLGHDERLAELDRREAELATREAEVLRSEARVEARDAALRAALEVQPRWSLPAPPVGVLLDALQQGTGEDLATVAKGLDVEPEWAAGVVGGRITEVDLPHVQQLCESLHCSPYDLWGKDDAERILHAYGPELWPRFIEPLAPPGPEPGEPAGPDLAP